MTPPEMNYRRAWVDLEGAESVPGRLAPIVRTTYRPEVLGGLGGFAGAFRVPPGYRNPVLVASTDGVGTKLTLLAQMDRPEVAGHDLVAMSVNDVLAMGADPIFFLDYYASSTLEMGLLERVVRGVAEACRQSGCTLLGGETAEMPGFYPEGLYELVGMAVGVAEEDRLVDGSGIRPGDLLIGLASSGPHCNGFSLIRRVLSDRGISLQTREEVLGGTVADALLAPTTLYVSSVQALSRAGLARGIAHITGGGLLGNLKRIIPEGLQAVVRRGSWPVPPIFSFLQEAGGVPVPEMESVFNMGVGLVVIVPAEQAKKASEILKGCGASIHSLGEIVTVDAPAPRAAFAD